MKKYSSLLYIALLALLVFTAFNLFNPGQVNEKIGLSTAIELSQSNNVGKAVLLPDEGLMLLTIQGKSLSVADSGGRDLVLAAGQEVAVHIGYLDFAGLVDLGFKLPSDYAVECAVGVDWGVILINFLPIIVFGLLIYFLFRTIRKVGSRQ